MKLTVQDIINSHVALKEAGAMALPMRTARKWSKNILVTQSIMDDFTTQNKLLLEKYGKQNKDAPDSYDIPAKNRMKYEKATKVLLSEELEMPELVTVDESELPRHFTISPTHLQVLDWMLAESKPKPKPKPRKGRTH